MPIVTQQAIGSTGARVPQPWSILALAHAQDLFHVWPGWLQSLPRVAPSMPPTRLSDSQALSTEWGKFRDLLCEAARWGVRMSFAAQMIDNWAGERGCKNLPRHSLYKFTLATL